MSFRVASGASGRILLRGMAAFGLATATLLSGPAASAASSCGMSPAREAFDVQGLKSELMVTALSCNAQDRYNAFIEKFRSDLVVQDSALKSYFNSSYGRTAQVERDNYITQLANVQSERGLRAGTSFCDQRLSMFDEVAVLDNSVDLGNYAEAKDIVQPATYETCSAPVLAKGSRVRRIRRTSHAMHRG